MPDFRSYCESTSIAGDRISLSKEESNHLVAANRARKNDPVRAFDGAGNEWDCTLVLADKHRAELQILTHHIAPQPALTIALGQALPKGKLLDSIIRKAAEIGIQEIFPLSTVRTESKLNAKKESSKNDKWHAASIEGSKQSGNPFLVQVHPLADFDEILAASQRFELKLIASLLPQALPLQSHIASILEDGPLPKSAIWLVGPEGDFTPEESEKAIAAGFLPTSLGPHVMRCETAATHAMSISRYALSETEVRTPSAKP